MGSEMCIRDRLLTFDRALDPLLVPDFIDFTIITDGFPTNVSGIEISGILVTLTLDAAVQFGDVLSVTYLPGTTVLTGTNGLEVSAFTQAVVNNMVSPLLATLTSIGTGAGVSTLRMESSSDIVLTLSANATFYTDAAGTAGASQTWTITAGALRTIYLKCTTGTATLTIPNASLIIKWGNQATDGWASVDNAASISIKIGKLTKVTELKSTGTSVLVGALPTGLTYLLLSGNSISWTYNGALPTGLTYLLLIGNSISWTGLDVGNNGNISVVSLINYRVDKMSSADMITLLTQLTNRTGSLPSAITINDYADYASPPAEVTTAVATLKSTKSITTVILGA